MAIAIYLRVSTDNQETEHQRLTVLNYCASKGYGSDELIMFEDSGISGKTMNRAGINELLDYVNNGLINKIITFELSRLSRDFMNFLTLMDTLQRKNVIVEVPGIGIQAFSNSTDKLVAAIKAFAANNERELFSQRIKSGLANAKKDGRKLGAPIGNQYKKGKQKIVDADLKNKILSMRKKNISFREIAAILGISLNKCYRFSLCS